MKKLIFVLMVSGLFLTACGDLSKGVTSPTGSSDHGAKQTDGSTVSILD